MSGNTASECASPLSSPADPNGARVADHQTRFSAQSSVDASTAKKLNATISLRNKVMSIIKRFIYNQCIVYSN